MDLADMSEFADENKGTKFLLVVIDIFSKYGWLIPLKNKTGVAVAEALRKILKRRKPNKIWVDKGKEFWNKSVRDLVQLYNTENEEKSPVVERWIRTMKEKMWKYFSANNTRKYIDVLDDLTDQYNNTIHSSIGMTPVDASKPSNQDIVRVNLYPALPKAKKPKLTVGDWVRITRKKKTFEKGYTPRWTEEIFKVTQILYTNPVTYKISDSNDEEIVGSFYEQELQKTTQEVFRIEKVLQRKGKKSLVKWFGYPSEYNSWIDTSTITSLT